MQLRSVAAVLQRLVDRIDPQAGRYRMLFESSALPMWVADERSNAFLAVNDAALRLFGVDREGFLSNRLFDAKALPGLQRVKKLSGERLDIEAVGHLVNWRGRRARLVIASDVTERLRAQEKAEALHRELEGSHERLRALSRRLLEVQEDERRRIARDLHDDIGQALTALKIQLGSLERAGDAAVLKARIAECVDTTQHTLERVRQLSLSLRPPQLDDLGLAAAIGSHLDRQARVAGLAAHFDAKDAPREVAPETETACFRIAQEAINNVLRHSHARTVWVRLYREEARLALSVRDDGCGFDLEAARRLGAEGRSLGLVGMEERVAGAHGSLEVASRPGQGTTVVATFPLPQHRKSA